MSFKLYEYLRANHRGMSNLTTVSRLAYLFETSCPQIREEIREMNLAGLPITTSRDGVFWSDCPHDFEIQIADLKSRIEKISVRIHALEKIVLAFRGQSRFDFDRKSIS